MFTPQIQLDESMIKTSSNCRPDPIYDVKNLALHNGVMQYCMRRP